MSAYFFCTMTIHDAETYRKYTAFTPATLARHSGKFLTRGDTVTTYEGDTFEERMVLLEFPDHAAAEAWYNDPEYQDLSKLRRASSKGRMFLQEGRANTATPDPKV
jgi:uncharacterized protein (DUF1330 family)